VGRAVVRDGFARLPVMGKLAPGAPIDLSAGAPNAVGTKLVVR
jgi:hypothetical protein